MCMIGDFVKMLDVPKSRPIKAYRRWYGTPKEPEPCCSCYHGTRNTWKGVGLVSRAIGVPNQYNTRGFWANSAARQNNGLFHNFKGPVLLWGKVAKHERGYRAQYAMLPKGAKYVRSL